MAVKIFIILVICATFRILETNGLRIKRNYDLENHNKRIKQDFIMLSDEKQDHLEASTEHIKTPAANSHDSNNVLTEPTRNRNGSKPLVEILGQTESSSFPNRKESPKNVEGPPAGITSKASARNENKSLDLLDKRCNRHGPSEEHLRHHKTKHLPRVIKSNGLLKAKIILPPGFRGLGSYGSMPQVMSFDNMMTLKAELDSSPFYPKMPLTQHSPSLYEAEPNLNYFFNSLEAPKERNLIRQALQQSASPALEDNWETHAIIYRPPASVREPIQLASLMQNALDSLLANSDYIEGNKNEQQIEFSCPVHHAKQTAQIQDDKADVIQLCSCRFIKKAKADDMKKLK